MLSSINSPKIGYAEILQHYVEVQSMKPNPKHTMYNGLLRLFRSKGIKSETLNSTTIICKGLLNGLWFRPNGNRCTVFMSTWHPAYRKGVASFDILVDYSNHMLFDKLLKHGIISAGTHEFLTTNNKD